MEVRELSDSQNINISYIILKRVIWRFKINYLFYEDNGNNEFREILKCFLKTTKLCMWNLKITRLKIIYDMFIF